MPDENVVTAPATTELDKLHDSLLSSLDGLSKDHGEVLKPVLEVATAYKTTRENFLKQKTAFETQEAAKNTPPEKYELALPKDSILGESYVDQVKAYAKEHKLTQARALEVLADRESTAKYVIDSRKAEFQKALDAGAAALKAHPVMGGANLAKTEDLVTRFIETYSPKAKEGQISVMEKLKRAGATVDPDIMELIYKAAQAIGPEKLILPKTQPNAKQALAGQASMRPPKGFSEIKVPTGAGA